MSRLTQDGTAEPVSRDQILRREREQGNINVPCSADHEQDWQPYRVNLYSCYICVTIHAGCVRVLRVLFSLVERSGANNMSRRLKIFATVAVLKS